MPFTLPPRLKNDKGQVRGVGFEIEYAGVDLEQSAAIVADVFGGKPGTRSEFHRVVSDTPWGDIKIELDTSILLEKKYDRYLKMIGVDLDALNLRQSMETVMNRLASVVVPYEIVTPPIPMTEMDIMERLCERLRAAGAKGTRSSIIYAFGLHVNPETPSLDARTLAFYLKAFFLVYDWILETSGIDLARRITPFIDPFPAEYSAKVVDPDYQPDINTLMADYVGANPTRNRALDLLPIFAVIDETYIRGRVEHPDLVSARPAFHFRLPNSLIDEPSWSPALEWQYWVEIEKLAADPEKINRMGETFLALEDGKHQGAWIREVKNWIT